MVEGPLGRDVPFISDNRTIMVLVGIDGPTPPTDVQLSTQELVNTEINKAMIDGGADIKVTRETVHMTVEDNPSSMQKETLGFNALHVQQFDIKTELEEVDVELVELARDVVVEILEQHGYNVGGTETTVK